MGENSNKLLILGIKFFSLMFVLNGNFVFALDDDVDHTKKMDTGKHHFLFYGIWTLRFVSLENICVPNERCGPSGYAGKLCIIDNVIPSFLGPLHQGYAGLAVDEIICAEGKELFLESDDAKPICITFDSVEKIKIREWQLTKPVILCTLKFALVCGMNDKTYGNTCSLHPEHVIMKHQGGCDNSSLVTNFKDCINAGNPVMESYPRQCKTENGKFSVEIINDVQKTDSSVSNFYVDSELVDCIDLRPKKCILIKEDFDSNWKNVHDQIDGFNFQAGYVYKLKIKINEIKNPPADASSLKYILIETIEKNNVNENVNTDEAIFPKSMSYTKEFSMIDSQKGYFVDEIADRVYWLIRSGYQKMLLTTGEGVIVVDATCPIDKKYLDVIASVTDEPVTHMIYSHSYADYTDFAGQTFPDDFEYIDHNDTADILISENNPNPPIPTVIFDGNYSPSVGNQLLALYYVCSFHSEDDLVIYSPEHKIAMDMDLFHTGVAPYKTFGVTIILNEHIKAHDTLVKDLDFEVLVSGNEKILGIKDHIKNDKELACLS